MNYTTNKHKVPLVSIVIPVFNVESYITDTLNSILSQDYNNFEVIVVNDGSMDTTGKICDEFASRHACLHVYHKKNGGVTAARKLGIEKSKGDWIIFVDGDDQLLAGAISFFVNKAIETQADIIQTPIIRQEANGKERIMRLRAQGIFDKQGYLNLLSRCYITNGIGGRMLRRELFDENTFNIPSTITNNEDLVMNYHLSDHLNRIYCNPLKTFYKYIARESSSSTRCSKGNWPALYDIYKKMAKTYGDAIYITWINSLYERYIHKDMTLSECSKYAWHIPKRRTYPLFVLSKWLFFKYPSLFTRIVLRFFASLDYKIHPFK